MPSITQVRIGYAAAPARMVAQLVHVWKRSDAEIRNGPVMSASSGPKAYLKNDIIWLFAADENIEQVAMLVLNRTMLLICKIGSHWYDLTECVTGKDAAKRYDSAGNAREVCVEAVKG